MVSPEEVKRLNDNAEECLALSDVVNDQQAREAYVRMAEAYRILAGSVGSEKPPLLPASGATKKARRHFKQTTSLKDRLTSFAREMREKASGLPSGTQKHDLLRRARLADTAAHVDDWISSPGLQPPK